jgi:hypothetical protein
MPSYSSAFGDSFAGSSKANYNVFKISNCLLQFIQLKLGVLFDSSCATAAQAATVEHESDRP